MKAAEILKAYQQGRRDFRGESLRGCNFARLAQKLPNSQLQGVDLSGADFSGCDIRGANFSYANLTGTKFEQAKAGLQQHWMVILWVASLLLIILASLFSALAGALVRQIVGFGSSNVANQINVASQIGGWVALIMLLGFMIVA
ncbi:MAG: pentapeptide repeat-containing protein, partial [Cyanobacteriota bacterium]|nr:pentapeptide repeat-containing protein [Cyanobacteriota bacterium]